MRTIIIIRSQGLGFGVRGLRSVGGRSLNEDPNFRSIGVDFLDNEKTPCPKFSDRFVETHTFWANVKMLERREDGRLS